MYIYIYIYIYIYSWPYAGARARLLPDAAPRKPALAAARAALAGISSYLHILYLFRHDSIYF